LVALSPNAGLQSFWAGVRRLHQTEVRLEAFTDLALGCLEAIRRSFRALLGNLLPRFLFVDDQRLEISLLSPSQLGIAVTKNLETLQEGRQDGRDDRSLPDLTEALAAGGTRNAVIYATPGCALRKTIDVPAGIRGNRLRQSLEYLLEVETPFRRDQVYWGFRLGARRSAAMRSVDLIVVPRSVIDLHVATLRDHGIHLLELCYRDNVSSDAPICLARYHERGERNGWRLLGILGIAVAVQIVAIAATPIVAQTIQASRLDDERARLSRIAADLGGLQSTLEKKMEPVRQAQLDLQSFPSSAGVLRTLEAELGKDTALDRLSLRGAIVQAAGSTPNVDLLTARLEKSQSLKPKSVSRNGAAAANQLELFSIALELVRAKWP
jgi:hypothetical protein